MTVIAERPTPEMYQSGLEIDCQCARCGGYACFEHCGHCEDGYEDRYEEDPLWYGHELYPCRDCDGAGGWHYCGNGGEWCEANPLPGRESVEHGKIEWFTVPRPA